MSLSDSHDHLTGAIIEEIRKHYPEESGFKINYYHMSISVRDCNKNSECRMLAHESISVVNKLSKSKRGLINIEYSDPEMFEKLFAAIDGVLDSPFGKCVAESSRIVDDLL